MYGGRNKNQHTSLRGFNGMIDKAMLPPQRIEAEESVIVSIFMNPESFTLASIILDYDDFYKSKHQVIFRAMQQLKSTKRNIDLEEVSSLLMDSGDIEKVGGVSGLVEMTMDIPLSTNVKGHSELILSASIARKTLAAAHEIIEKCYSPGKEDPLIFAQAKMMGIHARGKTDDMINFKDLLMQRVSQIEDITTTEGEQSFSLGFPTFDRLISLRGSRLVILAARPSHGKTALMMAWAKHLARNFVMSGIISLEMDKEQLADRAISGETGINTMKFTQYQRLTTKDWENINDKAQILSELPIIVDDEGSCVIEDIERKCRMMKQMGCDVIFIDQLSKIRGRRGQSETERYTENTNRLAELKKELRMPIVLLSQLNRDVEKRTNREPMLSDLKQTGSLEEEADMIFFLMRPLVYAITEEDKTKYQGKVILNLAKNRQGAIWREENTIVFEGRTTNFYEDLSRRPEK